MSLHVSKSVLVPIGRTVALSRKLELPTVCTPHPNLPSRAGFRDVGELKPYEAVSPLRSMIHAEAKLTEYRKHERWPVTAFKAELQEVATPSRDGDPNVAKRFQVWLTSRTRKQFLQPHVQAPIKRKGVDAECIRHMQLQLICPAQERSWWNWHGDKGELTARYALDPCYCKVGCMLLTFRASTNPGYQHYIVWVSFFCLPPIV